jgi:alpha-methylacyl-CoA racemase
VRARSTLVEAHGVLQAAPAPRFSRTAPELSRPPSNAGADTEAGLRAWGIAEPRIAELRTAGVIG